MDKELFIQPPVENIFLRMKFPEKYEDIAKKYMDGDDDFKSDIKTLLTIAQNIDYNFKYSKSRGFYLSDHIEQYEIKFGFSISNSLIDFGISIKNTALNIHSAAPLNYLIELISDVRPNSIMFKNYDDIKNLLSEVLELYEEFKSNLIIKTPPDL